MDPQVESALKLFDLDCVEVMREPKVHDTKMLLGRQRSCRFDIRVTEGLMSHAPVRAEHTSTSRPPSVRAFAFVSVVVSSVQPTYSGLSFLSGGGSKSAVDQQVRS